jgi:hypothetical protein
MSGYAAIRAVSTTLRNLLRTYITHTAEPYVAGVPIELSTPRELRGRSNDVVSLWLYQVERNAELLNRPPKRLAHDLHARRALPVNLRYLVTPLATDGGIEQALLGRVLQVFNDFAAIEDPLLDVDLARANVALRVSLEPLSLEELTRVWDALKEPYQLSVAYSVQVVEIDSMLAPLRTPPVQIAEAEVGQIVGSL